jgi:hypothetical protein
MKYDSNFVSDLHKDAYGYRPNDVFWQAWAKADEFQKQFIWDVLEERFGEQVAEEKRREKLAIEKFEHIVSLVQNKDQTREEAIAWMMKFDNEPDSSNFEYKHRLPFGYLVTSKTPEVDAKPPYVVTIQDWESRREINCFTVDEVWAAIGSRKIGGLYEVCSPAGFSVQEFIAL